MDKLFYNPPFYYRIIAGKLLFPFAVFLSLAFYYAPWEQIHDVPVYAKYVSIVEEIFPNIDRVRETVVDHDRGYMVAFWAFTNFFGVLWILFSLTQIRISDKIINGDYAHSNSRAAFAVIVGVIVSIATLVVATQSGMSYEGWAGSLIKTRYLWVLYRLGQWWLIVVFLMTSMITMLSFILRSKLRKNS